MPASAAAFRARARGRSTRAMTGHRPAIWSPPASRLRRTVQRFDLARRRRPRPSANADELHAARHRRRCTSGPSSACPTAITGAGRLADQRGPRVPRLHRPAGHRPTARPRWSPAMDDDWRPAFRVEALPSYKAHRVAPPGDERGGARRAGPAGRRSSRTCSTRSGIARVGVAGYEADDVIGTLATRARGPVDVVTGDRDLFQLVDDAARRPDPLHRPRRRPTSRSSTRRRSPRSTASRAGRTPTSRRCAATRATGCPASPASATRPRPR